MIKKNQGVTLVELLIGIAIGSLVTLAATTVILMGLRLNRQSMDVSSRHNTARVLLNSLEDLATDGTISGFRMDYEDWEIYGEEITPAADEFATADYQVLYSYSAEKDTVYTGNAATGTPIMKNVLSSYVQYEDNKLTVSVETEEGIFNSTVFCRMAIMPSGASGADNGDIKDVVVEKLPNVENITFSVKDKAARIKFIKILLSQYLTADSGHNYGWIIASKEIEKEDGNIDNKGDYYSQWYIGDGWLTNGWNPSTPWCACFVSWGVAESYKHGFTTYSEESSNYRPSFAGVDSFLAYFYAKGKWIYREEQLASVGKTNGMEAKPIYPGDVIFLDWVVNSESNPQHVGVVLYYDDTFVYTIEGNVSDGNGGSVVGLRKYKLDDPRILGYGVLDWKTDEEVAAQTPG